MSRLLKVALAVLLIPVWHCSTSSTSDLGPGGGFVSPTDRKGSVLEERNPTVVRAANVTIDAAQLTPGTRNFTLPVFGRKTLNMVQTRVDLIPDKGFIWYGKVAGEAASSAIFVRIRDTIVGDIDTASGKSYQIRYLGGAVYSIREIDRRKFRDEGPPLQPVSRPGGVAGDTCATDPPDHIDVMVVYTAAARTGAGGTDAMEATVYLAVAETNQSYFNSNINQRLRLVHTEEVTYTESGAFNTDLPRLQNGADGFMDNVPTLRNTFAADVVSLITESGDYCGLGYFMSTVSNSFESSAYSVVRRDCATGYFSFGHEIGHNMGADHDAGNASGSGAYPYNHGFFNTSPTSPATPWRTVMAYQTTPASTRVQYWSNPSVNYPIGNDPMGSATADNHQVLNNTALTVANFRCSSPSVGNVWMKDTWNDTGLEPDPHTAGEDMWKSPYIWVRNTQDTALVKQHQHENPEFGSTNWVYVKLHNGGASAASGNLELWYANASVSLTWPGSWTLLASTPVSGFAGHSTRIVETQWNSLPGTGHYCMVARWNSVTDPMATAEGPDINANVRANNNLVWRNLNIVDLLPDASGDATMDVSNPDRESGSVTLVVRPAKGEGKTSFFAVGQAFVILDPALLSAWQKGGMQGTGFKAEGDRLVIATERGATFENLLLPYDQKGRLRVIFRRLPSTPKAEYVVDVEQRRLPTFAARHQLPEVVGGVSYEIHTDRDHLKP
jgi:hypothetical protein